MTAVAVEEKTPKKGLFGGKGSKKDSESSPAKSEEKKDGSDDGSVASHKKSSPKTTNWLGKEVKRPRAEYQAEIDELKLRIAEIEADLENKTVELQQFKDWVGMAPSAF